MEAKMPSDVWSCYGGLINIRPDVPKIYGSLCGESFEIVTPGIRCMALEVPQCLRKLWLQKTSSQNVGNSAKYVASKYGFYMFAPHVGWWDIVRITSMIERLVTSSV